MFHGGTTRGFMNGANIKNSLLEPEISSYDYDAPLDEAGNATEKFMQFREVIQKYLPAGQSLPPVPAKKESIAVPGIKFTETTSLFDVLPSPKTNPTPLSFESLNQAYGFVLYRTVTAGNGSSAMLKINDLRDYGIVFINGKKAGVLDRRFNQDSLPIDLPTGKVTIDILVENLGRINYGPSLLKNEKGITRSVTLDQKELKGWEMYSLPFDNINMIANKKPVANHKPIADMPVLKKGSFEITTIGDTYLDMSNWGKGCVWVNGHNLGRYWNIGPQQSIYLPAEWLKKGKNEIVVLELLNPSQNILSAGKTAILDKLQ